MMSWQQKWQSICSKLETCRAECRTAYRSDQKCKDSIEAVVADLWHFMDWLEKDPATAIPRADLHAFIQTPEAFNIRGCADLATLDKHFEVSNPYRDDTRLTHESVDLHGDGHPLPFGAVRGYGNATLTVGRTPSSWRSAPRWSGSGSSWPGRYSPAPSSRVASRLGLREDSMPSCATFDRRGIRGESSGRVPLRSMRRSAAIRIGRIRPDVVRPVPRLRIDGRRLQSHPDRAHRRRRGLDERCRPGWRDQQGGPEGPRPVQRDPERPARRIAGASGASGRQHGHTWSLQEEGHPRRRHRGQGRRRPAY